MHNSDLYKKWQKKLLNLEINRKEKEICETKLHVNRCKEHIREKVSRLDFICLSKFIDDKINVFKKNVSKVHEKKLVKIGCKYSLNSCDPEKVVFNFSDVTLSFREKSLLSFGLDFGLPVYKPSFHKYFLDFEVLITRLKQLNVARNCKFGEVVQCIQNIARYHFQNFKSSKVFSPIISRSDLNLLRSLGRNRDLVVCRPDKGKGVVLLNKHDYISKMNDILVDTSKFIKLVNSDLHKLITKIEDKVSRFVNNLAALTVIDPNECQSLKPTGSSPAILYGLPKIHKDLIPLRPIMAAYNTASYKLSKFLVPILSPFTTNEYTVKNSYDLSHYLSEYKVPSSCYMVSYDVKSLFTNIPLDETIDICVNLAFSGVTNFLGMTKNFFKNLLSICVKENMFLFNGELYQQIDGVAMGSPLGPTFANMFLCYHECNWIRDCPTNFKPLLYKRYVDDTLVIFREKCHATLFLDYLNSKHNKISFTMETEVNSKIPFLDFSIEKDNGRLNTSVFRKPTFSGLGISFYSFCASKFKFNSIKTLLHRAYSLSSSYMNFHNEITFLRKFFVNNGFTIQIFDRILAKFLNDKFQPKHSIPTVNKEVIYVRIPYLGDWTDKIRISLDTQMRKFYPDKVFRFVPVNTFKIGSLFNFKDRLPEDLRSSLVYGFNCPSCHAGYVGSTIRSLKTRVSEHLGISSRTGRLLNSPSHSAVREHCQKVCKIPLRRDHFKILDSCPPANLRILESLHIKRNQPKLNISMSAFPLSVA